MNNIYRRLFVTITGLSVLGSGAFFVIREENIKRQNKIGQLEQAYKQNVTDFENYKKSYEEQVIKLKEDNIAKMEARKKEYDSLLASQQSVINSRTKLVADNSVPTTSTYTASSNSSSTTKTTVKVSKPKSTSTKSS